MEGEDRWKRRINEIENHFETEIKYMAMCEEHYTHPQDEGIGERALPSRYP